MRRTSDDLVGLGLYSTLEAAKLLRVPTVKLRRWADGYTFRARQGKRASPPVIRRQLDSADDSGILTFLDLMELHFVSLFRQTGVSMQVIRAAAAEAAKVFHTDHPFAVKKFHTDGKRIFATLDDAKPGPEVPHVAKLMEELARRQLVFAQMVDPFLLKVDFAAEQMCRYWPLGKNKRVVIDPHRAFGKPIDAETGVPTFALYQASQSGESQRSIAEWYNVPVDAVMRAVQFERWLLAA